MKKVVGLFSIFAISIFMTLGCASTSTFSSEAKQSSGNIVISTDAFVGTKVVEYKNRKLDAVFAKGTSALNFEPSFVIDTSNNIASVNLKVKFTAYIKLADSRYEKIIFLSDKGRLTVQLTPLQQSPEIAYHNQLFGDQCITRCNVPISKDEYLKLHDFIVNSASIRCAAYTTSNKAVELSEEGSSAHKIFSELHDYYEANLTNMIFAPSEKQVVQ